MFSDKGVRVYWNIRRAAWSVVDKSTGRVACHADEVSLRDCKFVVQLAGRKKVLEQKRKNVHAFVDGKVDGIVVSDTNSRIERNDFSGGGLKKIPKRVRYNPYKLPYFFDDDLNEIKEAGSALLIYKKVLARDTA